MSDDRYVIRAGGTLPAERDSLPPLLLLVDMGDRRVLHLGVTMTRQAAIGFRDLTGEETATLLLRVGLEELERGLRAGIYPRAVGDEYEELVFKSDDYERLRAYRDPEKECLWQERKPRGYICQATPEGSDARTTSAMCAGCVIPDERMICAHLAHPSIHAVTTESGGYERQPNLRPLCNVGKDPGVGAECFVGGLSCAERVVDARPAVEDPPPDIARRAADEVDYFALVFRDRYGLRVWTIPQARTISEFFGDCQSAEDFQRRVAALADLLARLDPYDTLDEKACVGEDGNRVGPLVALERLMERDHPEAVPSVRTLRRIPDARNAFPIHTRSEKLLDAMRALGVTFPAADWGLAWLQVLTTFWSAVQNLRVAIQTESREPDLQ